MPKYALTILTEQQLVVTVPPETPPFVVEDGLVKFHRDGQLQFAIPATNLRRCELMPEESPIVTPS